ncbi:MAG: helix-turn-helix domain-containing protein [Rhodobacter sp.]|nr:helix-turn-helix domain-containing protein [Rhodobacter sp.]
MSSVSGSGERILAILDLFSEDQPEWTPEAMMARLGYSRPTLYRYLKTLKDAGFLVSLPQAGYTLGPRVTELDFLMQRSDPMITAGTPHLKQLAADFPGSAFLVRWYGRKLLCIASEVSVPEPRSSYPRGRPMPLARGAISRAILAFLPRRDQLALLRDQPDASDDIMARLREVRRTGVAVAWGEVTPGVVGVAAPILADRAPIAALCLTSNEADATPPLLQDIRAAVRARAEAISLCLADSQPNLLNRSA